MEVADNFVQIANLLCEPSRARMLWNLLDGRAYTATEIAVASEISASSASNHLSKLLEANLLKVETQGRHRYYSFAGAEVAYVVESLANLANGRSAGNTRKSAPAGIEHCRTCYDHLAGFVGVRLVEALELKDVVRRTETAYLVTDKGWRWFAKIDIQRADFENTRRPLTRQCLDWSERRPHLAGQLGARLLETAFRKKWFKRVQFSRELIVTAEGRRSLRDLLGIDVR